MGSSAYYNIAEVYEENSDLKLYELLSTYSSAAKPSDNAWVMDKSVSGAKNISNDEKTLRFITIPEAYREPIKLYALYRLQTGVSLNTTRVAVSNLVPFCEFLNEHNIWFDSVDRQSMTLFQARLTSQKLAQRTRNSYWSAVDVFYSSMVGWPFSPIKFPVPRPNPFLRSKRSEVKPVPEYVLAQIDKIYSAETTPLERRVAYWLHRLIPNRGTEVSSMQIDCLKPNRKGYMSVLIPEYKQSGNPDGPGRILVTTVKLEGMGAFLVDLIKQQQAVARQLQKDLPIKKRGFLLTYTWKHRATDNTPQQRDALVRAKKCIEYMREHHLAENQTALLKMGPKLSPPEKRLSHQTFHSPYMQAFLDDVKFGCGGPSVIDDALIDKHTPPCPPVSWFEKADKPQVATRRNVYIWLYRELPKEHVVDEDGNLYSINPHQLRHNNVTDRMAEGWTTHQVMAETGHRNERMIEDTYDHSQDERQKKVADKIRERKGESIFFKGKIINSDAAEKILLERNIKAQRVGRLGICADMTSCGSGLFQCLGCDYLIPDAEERDYYLNKISEYEDKAHKAEAMAHDSLMNNALNKASLYKKLIERIDNAEIPIGGDNV
ncbi:MAG: hypothetical protein AB7D06_08110 [Pedobacter sp.]